MRDTQIPSRRKPKKRTNPETKEMPEIQGKKELRINSTAHWHTPEQPLQPFSPNSDFIIKDLAY
jgi:hypothetical protein